MLRPPPKSGAAKAADQAVLAKYASIAAVALLPFLTVWYVAHLIAQHAAHLAAALPH